MAVTLAYQIAGKTVGLSVTNSSHTAVTINATNPAANALLFTNTSTAEVMYVEVASANQNGVVTAPAASVPGDGTTGSIPVLSYGDIPVLGLKFPVSVTAISSIAGPTLLTATPIVTV